jgi:hypothetical protein
MSRRWARRLGFSLVLLSLAAGCDISVKSYAGATLQLSFATGNPSPPLHHLELWARDSVNDIIRVNGIVFDNVTNQQIEPAPFGISIVYGITFDDPCMIDSKGNLLTTAAAYPGPVTINGVTQTPDQQAQQVKNRISQLVEPALGGMQVATVRGVIPFTPSRPPTVAADAAPADRLAACQAYWKDPLAYTPNPAQLTAPIHGTIYGFLAYTTVHPPQGYDGFRIDTPTSLKGIQELWITDETAPNATAGDDFVKAANMGAVYMDGVAEDTHGRDVVHFTLGGAGGSGSAAILTNLDSDPVQY